MTKTQEEAIKELEIIKNSLIELPKHFGLSRSSFSSNFDYGNGKLRFDSWLKTYINFIAKYVPDSESDINEMKDRYDNQNCMPAGSGYGSKSNKVNVVFIKPFLNRIELIRDDIVSGDIYVKDLSIAPKKLLVDYISTDRIEELSSIRNEFDFCKLIALLKEINLAHNNEAFFSIGLLVRAVIDHIPPLFGLKTFKEVSNNYSGTKSLKDAMKGLESQLRKISDSYLHTAIRKKDSLPTLQQVDVRNSLDFILSEIVRVNK
jgi:hypothetical protein